MTNLLKSLGASKKFAAKVLGLLSVVGLRVGLPEDLAQPVAELATAIVVAYLAAQGVADHGKEKAKVENGGPK